MNNEKRILLGEWAKREGVSRQKARDMARRGRLKKHVAIEETTVPRLTVPVTLTIKDL